MTATRPSRAERVAEARRLREQGLLLREIGERMGVAMKTVHDYLADPDRSRLLARRERYRGVCKDCGAPTDGSNGKALAPDRCHSCSWRDVLDDQHAEHEALAAYVEARWAEGATSGEIADELGWKRKSVGEYISSLRAQGHDLPYRRPEMVENGRRAARIIAAYRAEDAA